MADPAPPIAIDVALAIVVHQGRLLICRRPDEVVLGGLWEFPGGKVQAGESIEQCLRRELREELDISVAPVRALPAIEHDYPHGLVRLHPFLCRLIDGTPRPLASSQLKWVEPAELRTLPFPPANAALLETLLEALGPDGAIR